MRLYYVELRRQLKTKSVCILIAIGFLLTLVLSYLPIARRYQCCRSTAGYHIRKAIGRLYEEMEGMAHEE